MVAIASCWTTVQHVTYVIFKDAVSHGSYMFTNVKVCIGKCRGVATIEATEAAASPKKYY